MLGKGVVELEDLQTETLVEEVEVIFDCTQQIKLRLIANRSAKRKKQDTFT